MNPVWVEVLLWISGALLSVVINIVVVSKAVGYYMGKHSTKVETHDEEIGNLRKIMVKLVAEVSYLRGRVNGSHGSTGVYSGSGEGGL